MIYTLQYVCIYIISMLYKGLCCKTNIYIYIYYLLPSDSIQIETSQNNTKYLYMYVHNETGQKWTQTITCRT